MGQTTHISWSEATWNPWQGCRKVSPGCRNCYMYRQKEQYGQDPSIVVRSSPATFRAPLRWKEPRMVFTCSWSDFFIEQADLWRGEAWQIIERTPQHTYQILTKRPDEAWTRLPPTWPWANVWLGISAENGFYLGNRWRVLRQIVAPVRWISYEPILGPITVPADCQWLVCGGESGPNYRLMQMAWLEDVVAQCDELGIPVFVKQDSGPRPGQQGRIPDALWARKEWPR